MKPNKKSSAATKPLPPRRPPAVIEDGSGVGVMSAWLAAGLAGGIALAITIWLPFDWVFDFDSPDFNPMLLLVLGLIVFAFANGVKALWRSHKREQFGKSVIEIAGDGVGRLGTALIGQLKTERPLPATTRVQLTLACLDTHSFRDISSSTAIRTEDYHAFCVWEEKLEVSLAGLDSTSSGIPFRFPLPDRVGEAAKPQDPSKPYFKFKGALMIPGLKPRIWTHGEQPVQRQWRLEARAETDGRPYYAVFTVPFEQP